MATQHIEMLRKLPFLQDAEPGVVEQLAQAVAEKSFWPGEVVFEEGSTGCEIYLIVEGLVEVWKGQGDEVIMLAKRGPGNLLGEMGFLENSPRFATIRAVEPTRLLELSEETMRSMLSQHPLLLYKVVRLLSSRLRESDLQMITDLQLKNRELTQAYHDLKQAQAALVEKERLERELELACEMQDSILPHTFPKLAGLGFAARSRPARQVGGDFYDVIPLSDGKLGLVMADVSDKGMSAALFMALTHSLIHVEAGRSDSPRQVLLNVHHWLLEMSKAKMFVTVFYGVLDPARGTLRYARAGHDYPLLYHAGAGVCQSLEAKGTLLGFLEMVNLEEANVDMHPGDVLVMYTDGITDVVSPAGELFGRERLRNAVCAANGPDAQGLCDFIFERVARFQAEAVQYDDMALLVVKSEAMPL